MNIREKLQLEVPQQKLNYQDPNKKLLTTEYTIFNCIKKAVKVLIQKSSVE
jgi:hypothetical protein